jgi:hypothetical protein
MSYQIPDFDAFLKMYPNLTGQSQAVGQIYVEAATDIVKEQGAAAEAVIDLGTKAMALTPTSEPMAYASRQAELQGELLRALGTSAERIFTIASEANNKAFHSWMSAMNSEETGTADA